MPGFGIHFYMKGRCELVRYRRFVTVAIAFLFSAACIVAGAQEPKKDFDPKDFKKDPRDFGKKPPFDPKDFKGPMPFAPPMPGQILPSFMRQFLKLTDEQKKKVDELQKEVDEKLAKILNDDQNKQINMMRSSFGKFKDFDKKDKKPEPKTEELKKKDE
jgi:hypothetical protein